MEKTGIITFQGNPLTLIGNEVKVGDKAPEFEVLANDLSSYTLSSCSGKVRIISCVPSLDTPVCDTQTRRFNEEITDLGNDIVLLTISMDLPFAQVRWCGTAGIDKAITLSDHRKADFGEKFGVLIKELRLLSRAIFIVDKDEVIRYIEIVPELTNEPNYDAAIKAVRDLL
ncbi:unnamed protein product [marine sediment metagenome]|uniref:Thioredoxin domain-containing protein n=1 Tax=marine sediment metagenome TaxID=412755 RepID=X0U7X7_9ZZZZ